MKLKHVLSAILFILFNAVPAFAQQTNPYKAPLYWSVYEYLYSQEQNGITDNYIQESVLQANIDWVDQNLKPYGYNMICMDGWGDVTQLSPNGYRASHSKHWTHDFTYWSSYLQTRGMSLGMYGDPLWIHVDKHDNTTKIVGTNINVSSLIDTTEVATFTWVQVDRPGAEEYVKGCIKYYADMGIKYYRCDFLSWYETGYDRNLGRVGPNRPRSYYLTALQWMRQACDQYGVFLSLVMPNLVNEAQYESQYGNMFRINSDAGTSAWTRFSDLNRGHRFAEWSQYENAMDGYTYWSYLSGRKKVILDGDFIRLNTFASNTEKKSVISAHIIAGGPLSIADQYSTIGNDLWLYQNNELLSINTDTLVCKPVTNDPTNESSQVWTGQLSNGDWIVGFFNRENTIRTRSTVLNALGIAGNALVRDLWEHSDLGPMSTITADIPPHGCMVFKITLGTASETSQSITFNSIPDKVYGIPDFDPGAVASSGLPVQYEIASGPAVIVSNKVHLTGGSGTVFIIAQQPGNNSFYATMPKVQSFNVTSPHQQQMFVAGSFSGWNLTLNPMSLVDNIWVAKSVTIPAGYNELKFANTNNWTGNDWGNASGLTGYAKLSTGGKPNLSFTMPSAGSYDIYFGDLSLQYSIGSKIIGIKETSPVQYELSQNYPNPFNPSTSISYSIGQGGMVTIKIFDILGQEIKTLVNEYNQAGSYNINFNADSLPSGVYIYSISSDNYISTKKMLLMK